MNVDSTDKEVTCISLFTGGGALELGVRRVIPNLRVVAYVEIEAYAVALLAKKIERGYLDEAPIFTDVTQFPAEVFRDRIQLVVAGYPCQDFSTAGKRAGLEGNRGEMWGFTRSIVSRLRARAFFGENVEGHISLGLDSVVSDLGEDGFMVKAGLYSAFEVGAPHLRKRIFSLSFKSDPRKAPWDQFKQGNQGWLNLHEAEFQSLTTGRVELANPPGVGRERGGGPDEGSPPETAEGRGDGDGRATSAMADDQGDRHRGLVGSRGDAGRLPDEEGEERHPGGCEAGGGSECDGELADADHERARPGSVQEEDGEISQWDDHAKSDNPGGGGTELADADNDGLHGTGDSGALGGEGEGEGEGGDKPTQAPEDCSSTGYARGKHEEWPIRWPARPGYQQHDWEAPRVLCDPSGASRPQDDEGVGDSQNTGCGWADDEHEEKGVPAGEHALRTGGEPGEEQEAQSLMGGKPDAPAGGLYANRIDRLRMLGNGVVWLTAAKAFSELLVQHQENVEDLYRSGKLRENREDALEPGEEEPGEASTL